MKLTSFTDYSLRVLIYLAAQPARNVTISEIAAAFSVSEHHLTKVVHFLGQCGLLANSRGKGGGLALAFAPSEVRIGEVVRQTEGEGAFVECFEPGGGECRIAPACRLRGVLADAVQAFYDVLDDWTLEDLVANRGSVVRYLRRPAPGSAARRSV